MIAVTLKPVVVIGLLGTIVDRGKGAERWNAWRPTVDVCRHDDLVIRRFELLHGKELALVDTVGDLTIVLQVVGEIDGSHPSTAELALEAIVPVAGACGCGHGEA